MNVLNQMGAEREEGEVGVELIVKLIISTQISPGTYTFRLLTTKREAAEREQHNG